MPPKPKHKQKKGGARPSAMSSQPTSSGYAPLPGTAEAVGRRDHEGGSSALGGGASPGTGSACSTDIEAGRNSSIRATCAPSPAGPRRCSRQTAAERRLWEFLERLKGSELDTVGVEGFAQLLRQGARLPLDQAELQAAFQEMDVNNDGQVSVTEMVQRLKAMTARAAHEEVTQLSPSARLLRRVSAVEPLADGAMDTELSLPKGTVAAGFEAWVGTGDFQFDALLPHNTYDDEGDTSTAASEDEDEYDEVLGSGTCDHMTLASAAPEPEAEPEARRQEKKKTKRKEKQRSKKKRSEAELRVRIAASEASAALDIDTELAETRRRLEDLEINTISGLVEPVQIDVQGQSVQKQLLFLSTNQARKFDMSSLSKVLTAMDIVWPKLIITMFMSGFHAKNCRSAGHASHPQCSIVKDHTHAEASEWELLSSLRRVEAFMEDIVLPVARQTKALVIVEDTDCHLAFAFSNVCLKYAKANGGELPFTLISFACTEFVSGATLREGSTAYKLKEASTRPGGWKQCHAKREAKQGPDKERCYSTPEDVPEGCTHYVMVDGEHSGGAIRDLRTTFVQKLTADLPSIALGAYDTEWTDHNGYLSRKLPVLLLDSRPLPPRGYARNFADMRDDLLALETQLITSGCTNFNSTIIPCAGEMAHVHKVLNNVLELDERFARERDGIEQLDTHSLSDGTQMKWIYALIEDWERKERAAQRDGAVTDAANATPSKAERASEAIVVLEVLQGLRQKVVASWVLQLVERFERSLAEVMDDEEHRQRGIDGLNTWLKNVTVASKHTFHWVLSIGEWSTDLFKAHNIRTGGFIQNMRGQHEGHLYCFVPQVATEECTETPEMEVKTVKQMKEQLLATVLSWKDAPTKEIVDNSAAQTIGKDSHIRKRNMLLSPYLYSGNLCDTQRLEQIMQQVASVSRLPKRNTIEATRTICQVWDSVDLFTAEARRSKVISKISYGVLLLVGVAAITVTTVSLNRSDIIEPGLREDLVLALSLLGTAIASATTFLNPAQRWTQLRGAALTLESECWKFRTRSGIYALSSANSSMLGSSEETLRMVLESVRQHVGKSASVSETAFGSTVELFGRPPKSKLNVYTHGQYRGCGVGGTYGHASQVAMQQKIADGNQRDELRPGQRGAAKGTSRCPRINSLRLRCSPHQPLPITAAPASAKVDPVYDDHHSPVAPEKYLQLRVEPMVRFYQSRLPSYYRARASFEVIMVLGSLSGTLMAFLHIAEWVAVVMAVTAMITAWSAFSGTDNKLSRYSNTIEKVQSIMLWWRSLSATDKALPSKINHLVTSCEETFERERESWASTSMATALLAQAAGDASDEDEKE